MALELLAGPFPVTYGDTDEPVNFSNAHIGYHDSIGIIGTLPNPIGRGVIVQLDGVAYQRNVDGIQHYPQPNFRTGGLCVATTLAGVGFVLYHTMDLRVLRGVGAYTQDDYIQNGWAIFPDRILRGQNGHVLSFDPAEANSSLDEFELDADGSAALGQANISPGPKPGQAFFSFPTGRIYLYDYANQALVGRVRTITANLACFYSPKWRVFIAVHNESGQHVTRVWADETRPTTVAVPTLDATPVRGLVVTAETTVSGDDDDVCPGLNVLWTTTIGTVLDTVTETDADGVATARIRLDPEEAATDMAVTATVLV